MIKPYFETNLGKLYCGDCIEVMKELEDESINLVLTDPPYNIGDKSKVTKENGKILSNHEVWGEWDNYENDYWLDYIFKCFVSKFTKF